MVLSHNFDHARYRVGESNLVMVMVVMVAMVVSVVAVMHVHIAREPFLAGRHEVLPGYVRRVAHHASNVRLVTLQLDALFIAPRLHQNYTCVDLADGQVASVQHVVRRDQNVDDFRRLNGPNDVDRLLEFTVGLIHLLGCN
jgi:hypothetical protein